MKTTPRCQRPMRSLPFLTGCATLVVVVFAVVASSASSLAAAGTPESVAALVAQVDSGVLSEPDAIQMLSATFSEGLVGRLALIAEDGARRRTVYRLLAKLPEGRSSAGFALLAKGLGDSDDAVRRYSASGLRNLKDSNKNPAATVLCDALLAEKDSDTSNWILSAFSTVASRSTPKCLDVVETILRDQSSSPLRIEQATRAALAMSGISRVLPLLQSLKGDALAASLRSTAGFGAETRMSFDTDSKGRSAVRDLVLARLTDPSEPVREAARTLLPFLFGPEPERYDTSPDQLAFNRVIRDGLVAAAERTTVVYDRSQLILLADLVDPSYRLRTKQELRAIWGAK